LGIRRVIADLPSLFSRPATIWLESHVDDTFVYANTRERLLMASSDINRHYQFNLDEKADSFLGIMIEQLVNRDF
jgi:hypothetical protein